MAVIGIDIREEVISPSQITPQGFSVCHLVGTGATSIAEADLHKPITVKSFSEFETNYPDANEIVKQSIKLFFINSPNSKLVYYPTKADIAGYTACLEVLAKRNDLELGFLIIPEQISLTTQADKTTLFASTEETAKTLDWVNLVNSSTTITTKEEIIEERKSYASPQGHSALFYSTVIDLDDTQLPITPIVAAIALERSRTDSPFAPPGGANYPIKGIKQVENYIDNRDDYKELQSADINVIQDIPRIGYCLWGARSLANSISANTKFGQINTRMAISIIAKRLEIALTPLVFGTIDPQGFTRREVVRIIVSIMQTAYLQGALSGATPEEAFRVAEEVIKETDTYRKIAIRVYAKFVGTLEDIEVTLINVDTIPNN